MGTPAILSRPSTVSRSLPPISPSISRLISSRLMPQPLPLSIHSRCQPTTWPVSTRQPSPPFSGSRLSSTGLLPRETPRCPRSRPLSRRCVNPFLRFWHPAHPHSLARRSLTRSLMAMTRCARLSVVCAALANSSHPLVAFTLPPTILASPTPQPLPTHSHVVLLQPLQPHNQLPLPLSPPHPHKNSRLPPRYNRHNPLLLSKPSPIPPQPRLRLHLPTPYPPAHLPLALRKKRHPMCITYSPIRCYNRHNTILPHQEVFHMIHLYPILLLSLFLLQITRLPPMVKTPHFCRTANDYTVNVVPLALYSRGVGVPLWSHAAQGPRVAWST